MIQSFGEVVGLLFISLISTVMFIEAHSCERARRSQRLKPETANCDLLVFFEKKLLRMRAEILRLAASLGACVCFVTAALLLTDSCLRGSGRRTWGRTTVATRTTPPSARGALPPTPGHTSDTSSAAYQSARRVGLTHRHMHTLAQKICTYTSAY